MAIAMPDTLTELMIRGRWSDIVLLQRWHTSALPAQGLLAHWPPLHWKPNDLPVPVANTELTVESLDQLAQTVISWVPLLQGQAAQAAAHEDGEDGDLDADPLTGVARVVATLKSWRDTLRGSQPKFAGRGKRMHEASKLLAYLRCAWYARSTHNLEQVIERAVLAVMSWPMAKGVLQSLKNKHVTISKGTLQRYRLCLDIAYLYQSQEDSLQRTAGPNPQLSETLTISSVSVVELRWVVGMECKEVTQV